jgi:hypothetical protein
MRSSERPIVDRKSNHTITGDNRFIETSLVLNKFDCGLRQIIHNYVIILTAGCAKLICHIILTAD